MAVVDDGDAAVAWDPQVMAVRLWMNAWDRLDAASSCLMDPYSGVEASFYTCEDALVVVVEVGDCHHGADCNGMAWSPVDQAYDDADSCSR